MKKLDFHIHIFDDIPIEKNAEYLRDMCERCGYEGVGIMALSFCSPGYHKTCNEDALKIRDLMPGSYAFAALHHDRDFVEQAKEYMAQGFDGIKLLEGKPSTYKYYGYGYEHPRFEPFFAYAEEQGIPLMMHNNDPIEHWDRNKMSPRAIELGWCYDEEGFPTQEDFYKSFENILERHPRLRAAVAHAGFYSKEYIDRAEALLEKYPNFMLDMTPALCIFSEFSANPERTRELLMKYHDRLLFGTDADANLVGRARELNDKKVRVMKAFYEGSGFCEVDGMRIYGFELPEHMLENIYYNNAIKFMKRS